MVSRAKFCFTKIVTYSPIHLLMCHAQQSPGAASLQLDLKQLCPLKTCESKFVMKRFCKCICGH